MNKADLSFKCYLCGNSRIELVSEKLRYESSRKAYKCLDCSLVFLYPQMTAEEEKQFYEKEYGDVYSKEKGVTPRDLFKSRQADAKLYYKLTKKYLNKDMECLEIGCASGYFLYEIINKVKSVAGVESHILLRQYCEEIGIKMFDSLDSCPRESFDIVFLFFVLEHIGDPISFLMKIKRLLKNKGKLFIEVPNSKDALLTLYDILEFKNYYCTPAHQFYYTKETLEKLFWKSGFEEYDIKTIQRYDLSNHMHWMMYGKPGGVGKYNHIFSAQLNKKYKDDLVRCDKGDTLVAIVNK